MILTKSGGILGPIASVLGIIMDFLFHITGQFGIFNVGLCIILFTIVTKMLMLPLTIKQQKSTKLMSIMNPEIQAIQAKYKGKKDYQDLFKKYFGINDYDGHIPQVENIVEQLTVSDFDNFVDNLKKVSSDDNVLPSTNFLCFIDKIRQ